MTGGEGEERGTASKTQVEDSEILTKMGYKQVGAVVAVGWCFNIATVLLLVVVVVVVRGVWHRCLIYGEASHCH